VTLRNTISYQLFRWRVSQACKCISTMKMKALYSSETSVSPWCNNPEAQNFPSLWSFKFHRPHYKMEAFRSVSHIHAFFARKHWAWVGFEDLTAWSWRVLLMGCKAVESSISLPIFRIQFPSSESKNKINKWPAVCSLLLSVFLLGLFSDPKRWGQYYFPKCQ
jgi:hypothetical protein